MRTSESITKLAAALVAFQAEISNPKHSATADVPTRTGGRFSYRYTPLHDILNHIRPILAKHKLAVLQSPRSDDGESITVTTLLVHESGEWIEADELTMKAEKISAQGAGSIITYARRYALSAVLGISSEDDDDAGSTEPQGKPKQTESALISEARARRMFALAKGNADIVRQVLGEYNIGGSKQVPNSLYDEICDKIQILASELKGGTK